MDVLLKHKPAYSLAVVTLAGGEEVRAESGAMVSYSEGVQTETLSRGGFLGGLKRVVGGESFFQNTWKAPGQGGEVTLAPTLPGDMMVIELSGGDFYLQSGAFVACEASVETDTKWGGAKGFFGSSSLILLRMSGQGKVVLSAYGAIEERTLQPGQKYTVDTGHIVGFSSSIQFQVRRVGNWKSTLLSGEGLVCELTGPGSVLMQTRSEDALIGWLAPRLPSKGD
jgi:uncharacterized protein (TIGR00266 family)